MEIESTGRYLTIDLNRDELEQAILEYVERESETILPKTEDNGLYGWNATVFGSTLTFDLRALRHGDCKT